MTAPTQQPLALQLADRQEMAALAWVAGSQPHKLRIDTASELRRQHAEIARLTADNRALRANCKPLTSEQKTAIFQSRAGANDHGVPYLCCYREGFEHIVADIEVAHGIGEKP